ncbi:MAG: hypothetical protein A2787_08910 [Omnitrophica WOR_2 bacterium RIFCSPHIGHO2_01_FULL_48_9]|nr:MAG: hypothetical protein A2787_08910 [Omnitrophica WOR_2 bacterium RIFCSPHIGHO2_01_FULL_48_9]
MNLYELSQLDFETLKNMDWGKILSNLLKRKDSLIMVLLILAVPASGVYIFSNRRKEASALMTQAAQLEKQIKAIEAMGAAEKELNDFTKKLPADLPDTQFLKTLNDLARVHKIQIQTIYPVQTTAVETYSLSSVELDIYAPQYERLWDFINAIENSEYLLRVEGWSAAMDTRSSLYSADPNPPPTPISSRIKITSVHIKR